MAVKGQKPALASPLLAQRALEKDLPIVLKGRGVTWEESGWIRHDDLTLLIPMAGFIKGIADVPDFLLKLGFHHYPEWPPSAQFVNPATKTYVYPADEYWLPRLESDEVRTHANHPHEGRFLQLICSSITLEFYEINHGVDDRHVWNSSRQNFAATINAIEWALKEHYNGRFSSKAP